MSKRRIILKSPSRKLKISEDSIDVSVASYDAFGISIIQLERRITI